MKNSKYIIFLFIAGFLGASAASHRYAFPGEEQVIAATDTINLEDIEVIKEDTVSVKQKSSTRNYLPREVRDTAEFSQKRAVQRDFQSKIHLLARTYGDSIILRWAPEDYVSWQYLNAVGVDIYRMPIMDSKKQNVQFRIDTIAHRLKPATLEQWRYMYPESDSVAVIAMGRYHIFHCLFLRYKVFRIYM